MFLLSIAPFTNIATARKTLGVSYLGGINTSAKLLKNQKISGYYTYIVYLAPANTSGCNVCSHSTPECRKGCLDTSGRAMMELNGKGEHRIQNARIRKTLAYVHNQDLFMRLMVAEIKAAQRKAIRDNYFFSVRLNGTSDIDYSAIYVDGKNIFEIFPEVPFYDYTKNPNKFINKPANYHLTLSYTGHNWNECLTALNQGYNVAMIFNCKLPRTYAGFQVINGDLTDLRIGEAKGIIVGLKWKRIADKDLNNQIKSSIFAIQENNSNINQ